MTDYSDRDRRFAEAPVIAILRGLVPDQAIDVGEALLDAGIATFEVPLNSPEPFDSIRRMASHFGERAIVGAGTVLDVESVVRLKDVGAQLVVSPNSNAEVVAATVERDMISCPGILTPTDAFSMVDAGATTLKIYPAGSVGKGFVGAVKAVLPAGTRLCAVGGVDAANAADWFAAGADAIGIGTGIFKAGDDASIVAKKAAGIMDAVRQSGRA